MLGAFDRFWRAFDWGQLQGLCMAGWFLAGLGALALLVARRAPANEAERRFWIVLAVLGPILCIEMGWPTRYVMARSLRSLFGPEAIHGRRPWQAALVVIAVAAAVAAAGTLLRRSGSWSLGSRVAALGLIQGSTGFVLETISLHQVDAHYGIYWVCWFVGLAVLLSGVGLAWIQPVSLTDRESRGARTYRIPGMVVEKSTDSPRRILTRLAWVAVGLALPELVGWLSGS